MDVDLLRQGGSRSEEAHRLDVLFLERFIQEVDKLKTRLDTNTETLYRLSRDVSELREDLARIKLDIEEPVKAYDYGVFTVSILGWIKPVLFSAIGAAIAWLVSSRSGTP